MHEYEVCSLSETKEKTNYTLYQNVITNSFQKYPNFQRTIWDYTNHYIPKGTLNIEYRDINFRQATSYISYSIVIEKKVERLPKRGNFNP